MLAILSPGQGAQRPGFLAEWLQLPGWAERIDSWSPAAGIDLVRAGTTAGAEEIRDTRVAQPLLVAAALASVAEVRGDADVLAGHSVGEFAAAALAGIVSAETALHLVRIRGAAMTRACHGPVPTGMSAVVGGDPDAVIDRLTALGLEAANRNGAGQIVAAGRVDALDRLAAAPPAGSRVLRLEVAGAFHTPWMAPAQHALAAAVESLHPADPHTLLVGNADGALVHSGRPALDRLVAQVTSAVRFDACLATLRALGVTGVIEALPGGTLRGLVRRELPDAEVVALRGPGDLAAARALAGAHRAGVPAEDTPPWRLVVATEAGRFTRADTPTGTPVAVGVELGRLRSRRDDAPVVASHAGVLVEWLAEDGDPVSAGQPLARLHPEGTDA